MAAHNFLSNRGRGFIWSGSGRSQVGGGLRAFRYEIRCWPGGVIPDVDEAVDSPRRLSGRPDVAERVLALVAGVPTPTWGRDELNAGEMWNSNSVVSWLLVRSGIDAGEIALPAARRAPGWQAGLKVASR